MDLRGIARAKAKYYKDKIENNLRQAVFVSDAYGSISRELQDLSENLIAPIAKYKEEIYFDKNNLREFMSDSSDDIEMQMELVKSISDDINEVFNSNQDFKTSTKNQLAQLKHSLEIASFKGNKADKLFYIRDSFSNYDLIDMAASGNQIGEVLTSEGIITLKTTVSNEINPSSISVAGNGESGNKGVLRTYAPTSENLNKNLTTEYLEFTTPNNDIQALLDNDPVTIYEYQNLADPLFLDLSIELPQGGATLNWIEIEPYIPSRARHGFTIDSIEFEGSTSESIITDSEISLVPNKGEDSMLNIKSQGVFHFPSKQAKNIHIRMSQKKWYNELLGETIYRIGHILQDEASLPDTIRNGPPGIYTHNGIQVIKEIKEIKDPKRFSIGIRDISLSYREFDSSSIFISKTHKLPGEAKAIRLHVNEYIPSEFIAEGNIEEWIQYYIRVGDSGWKPISPESRPLKEGTLLHPNVYLINSITPESVRQISSDGFIDTGAEADNITIKIVLNRPEGQKTLTPIVEQYVLECEVQ